jgi:uncharacterized protein YeaC (DUF1315 family)
MEMNTLFSKRPDSMSQLITKITPAIYSNLKDAIALGKWEDGSRLDSEQLEYCMQALILYEAKHFPEQARTGARLARQCIDKTATENPPGFSDERKDRNQ